MLAFFVTGPTGTRVDLFDIATVAELDDVIAPSDNYSSAEILDQAGVAELLADHHWRISGSWNYGPDLGATYCTVYQRS